MLEIDTSPYNMPHRRMFISVDGFFDAIKNYVDAINAKGLDATIIPADDTSNMIIGFGCLETNVVFQIKHSVLVNSNHKYSKDVIVALQKN